MKVPSFKKFLEEEDSKAIVQTGLNSKSIDNSVTKEIINSRLANATSNPFLTPYIALGSIARILAYVNIVVPQYTFLDRDEGEVVFDATQVGQIAGVNLDGSPAKSEADHFIYFSYSMNDEGYYDCFAALVDSDELEDIMDMGGDDDVDQFDVDQKVNEELKGNQHKLDVAEPKGKLTSADFKKLRGEKSVDEGEDKKQNKSKKRNLLRQLGYKDSPVDFTSPGNTAAMAVRAGRDKLKKEEAQHVDEAMKWDETSSSSLPAKDQDTIKGHEQAHNWHAKMLRQVRMNHDKNPNAETRRDVKFYSNRMAHHNGAAHDMRMQGVKEEPTNPAAQAAQELTARIAAHKAAKPQPVRKPAAAPAPKSEPSVYDAAQKVKAAPSNPAAQSYKKEIAARQAGKKVDEESINERKSSDPKGLAYKVTAASHAANPQWGPADHTQDPKTHFGTAATRSSTLAAVRSIRAQRSQGGFDANNPKHVDAAAKAVHGSPQDYEGKPRGWSQTAMTHSGQSPEQKERRAKLTGPYGSLSEPEKEKDREIVRTVAANMSK